MKREESKILFSEHSRREMVFSDAVYHSLYTLVSCVQRSLYVPCKHDLYPLPLRFPQYEQCSQSPPFPTLSAIHMSSSAFTKPTQMSSQTATPLLSSTLQSPSAKEMWVLPLEEALGLGSACGIHLCLEVRSMMRVKHIFIKSCCCLVAKSCPTLCDPRDCRLPDLSVHVILRYSGLAQARIL